MMRHYIHAYGGLSKGVPDRSSEMTQEGIDKSNT
jgi:hypothetical protein